MHTQKRCCEQVRHAAAVQYSIHELLVADLYRWSWGRWRVSENLLQLLKYLKVEQQVNWLLIRIIWAYRELCDCKIELKIEFNYML